MCDIQRVLRNTTQRNQYGMPTMSTFYALIKIVTIP